MKIFKKGMYVRCPVDFEDKKNPRRFILGKIVEVDDNSKEAIVKFFDLENIREFFFFVPNKSKFAFEDIERCKIINDSEVSIIKENNNIHGIIILCVEVEESDYFQYYLKTLLDNKLTLVKCYEYEIEAQFNQSFISPLWQFLNYEFHNPVWYRRRNIVTNSMQTLKNTIFGFENLVSSRIFLYPHQADTVISCLNEDPCRFILADEVGMGKTVEALVIMKGLINKLGQLKTILIIPDSLSYQWKNELYYKFGTEIEIWEGGKLDENIKSIIINKSDLLKARDHGILDLDWNLCIIDEIHRYVKLKKEYSTIQKLSNKVKNILLLSATPIEIRKSEYYALLKLLEPKKYLSISKDKFEIILKKHSQLKLKIYKMLRNLNYFFEDGLAEDFLFDLKNINEYISDAHFGRLLEDISIKSEDMGLKSIQIALSYLCEQYQIEKRIIRHRRLELTSDYKNEGIQDIAKRILTEKKYKMVGFENSFYERDVYKEILKYLNKIIKNIKSDESENLGDFVCIFLSAMFSSPWALYDLFGQRIKIINNIGNIQDKGDFQGFLSANNISEKIEIILKRLKQYNNEKKDIEYILEIIDKWTISACEEINNIDKSKKAGENYMGRLGGVIDYILKQDNGLKFVIFSSWIQTLKKIELFILNRIGEHSFSCFYEYMSNEECQASVDRFQEDPQCRIIICDESGGEGRNFQIADEIIHIDIPWSPMIMEQRIGRLDRIGRDISKNINSVVFYSSETIEEELFKLYKLGLNIFEASISGLEIVLPEIYIKLRTTLVDDLEYGLENNMQSYIEYIKEMDAAVEEERYFDMAKKLNPKTREQLGKLINSFGEGHGQKLFDTMMVWAGLAGFEPNIDKRKILVFHRDKVNTNSMINCFINPKNLFNSFKKSKFLNYVEGTFDRKYAIEHEYLELFAPGEPFFDTIVSNAVNCDRGRSTAFIENSNFIWKGLIFIWNINPDFKYLLEIEDSLKFLYKIQGYLPLEQQVTIESFSKNDNEINLSFIKDFLRSRYKNNNTIHLGRRNINEERGGNLGRKEGLTNLDYFKKNYPPEIWTRLVTNAYKKNLYKIKNDFTKSLEIDELKRDLNEKIIAPIEANQFYGINTLNKKKIEDIYNAIYEGLINPVFDLDSISFAFIVKKDGKTT